MWLKDKFDSLMKKVLSTKSRIIDWLGKPKWWNRLILYSVLGIVVIAISHYVFSYFGFLHTDIDSARYMLSALVQGEAAIVALVVTLSLVAVQLAAQSYSARVIEVFRKAPDLWILMVIYGIAIFYGLGVLKLINKGNISDLEIYISGAYYFGIFAFVALVPYMLKTFEMLKPSTVIDMLAEGITKENILSTIKAERKEKSEIDPIQPVIDIIRGSLIRYDYETIKDGLDAIGKRTEHLFNNEKFENKDEKKVSNHVFLHISNIGRLVARRGDENSTINVIDTLFGIGVTAQEHKLEIASEDIARYLGYVGEEAAKQKFEMATFFAVDELGILGEEASRAKLIKISQQVTTSLKSLLEISKECQFKDVIRRGEEALHEINIPPNPNKK